MKRIDRLKKEALESCKFRGHKMERFLEAKFDGVVVSSCELCGRTVTVTPDPHPYECEIMGEAVAVNCQGWSLMFGLANLRLADGK